MVAKISCAICLNYNNCRSKFMELSSFGLSDIGKLTKDKTALHVALLQQIAKYCSTFKRVK